MSTKVSKPQKYLRSLFKDIAKDLFLYSIIFGNVFINTKDIITKPEVRVS